MLHHGARILDLASWILAPGAKLKANVGGLGELDREIDFDFDFDFGSFVHGGRGEAVCARERHASLTLGLMLWSCPTPRGGFVINSCCYTCGF